MISRLDKGGKTLYYCDEEKSFILEFPSIVESLPVIKTIKKLKKKGIPKMSFCNKCGVNVHGPHDCVKEDSKKEY